MSAADGKDVRLPEQAEALLASFSTSGKDDAFWEQQAQSISARIAAGEATSAELLAPPFPAEPNEQDASAAKDFQRAAVTPRQRSKSLTELARAVRDSKPDESPTEIAKASLSLASQARNSAPDIAARVRAASASRPSEPPASEPAPSSAVPAGSRPPPRRAKQRVSANVMGFAVAALAIAAVVALVVRSRTRESAPPEQAEAPQAQASATTPMGPSQPTGGGDPEAVNVDDLPGAEGEKKVARPRPGSSGERLAARKGAEPKPEKPAPASAASVAAAAPPPSRQPEKPDPELKPAEGPNSLPEKPSTGAVQAAIGSVMGGARSCVAGHDQPSSAVIVFGSDGRVQSVTVGGPAAGTPAGACIKAALSKARVGKFAKSSFSISATIRPR